MLIRYSTQPEFTPLPRGQVPNVEYHVPGRCLGRILKMTGGNASLEINMFSARNIENAVIACGGTVEHLSNVAPHTVRFN